MNVVGMLSLVVLMAPAGPPKPVAIVYSLTGTASLSAPARPLHRFDRLPAGAAIEMGPSSRLALAFTSGARYELGAGARVTLGAADLAAREGAVRELPRLPPFPRLAPIAARERPGRRAGAVRIRSEGISGLHPSRGAAVPAGEAVLRFNPAETGGPYRVEVQDGEGEVVFQADVEAPPARVPADALRPAARYGWTVRTLGRPGPVARGEADFVTLAADDARAREALRAAVATEGDGDLLALLAEIDRGLGMLPEDAESPDAEPDESREEGTPGRLEPAALRLVPQWASDVAQIFRAWGEWFQQRNAWDRAEACYRQALRLEPEESLAAAQELSALGVIARRRDDLAGAEDLYRKALSIRTRLAPESLDVAASHSNLGILAAVRGDTATAEAHFVKALELQQRLAPDSLLVAGTITNLGNIAVMRGDPATAEERFQRAVALIERLNPDDPELARVLSCLGDAEKDRGELALAEHHYQRALALRQKLMPDSLEVAGSLHNLAFVAESRGDFAMAEALHRRALEIRERLFPDSPEVAASLNHLGVNQRLQGDPEKADDFFRRAMEIHDRHTPEKLGAAKLRIARARNALELGKLDQAEELYSRALASLEAQYSGSLPVSEILEGQGAIALQRGNLPQTEELFGHVLAIREQIAPGSTGLAQTLNDLGRLYRRSGRLGLAAERFCRATRVLDQQRKKLGGTLEERSAFGGTTAEPYRECLAALIDVGHAEEAFQVLERGRARSFLELLAERDLRGMTDLAPEVARERREADADYDRTLAALGRLSAIRDQAEIGRLSIHLRELRGRQEEIAAKVRQASPRTAALQDPQPLDLAGARAALDSRTVLLAWSVGRERSYLFVVRRAGLEVFPLGIGDPALRKRVEAFLNLLQRPGSDRRVLSRQGRELYDLLLRPAETRIAEAARLLVSPDGPLHMLPFAALIRKGRYLAEDKPVHTIISATVYAELRKSRRERLSAPQVDLAAFGDPSYPPLAPGQSSAAAHPEVRAAVGRGLALTALPSTREEVRDIAALYPRARTFLGAEATEERAKSIGQDARYVHFACHGLLDERFPLNSALALTIPGSPGEGEENGLLQAWEIFESLRLDADLVTLSACDSARGREMGGEGLLGLTRAFQYAGARSVLASLWSVSDISTADLMKRFYGHLRQGKSKDEALQAAQMELLRSKDFAHPYYWAAFQLTGDWR